MAFTLNMACDNQHNYSQMFLQKNPGKNLSLENINVPRSSTVFQLTTKINEFYKLKKNFLVKQRSELHFVYWIQWLKSTAQLRAYIFP